MIHIDDNKNNNKYVIFTFSSEHCAPCKELDKIMKRIDSKYEDITYYKLDVEENIPLTEEYQIKAFPTTFYYKNGYIIECTEGLIPETEIKNILEK
jgi:thioredoxin 1